MPESTTYDYPRPGDPCAVCGAPCRVSIYVSDRVCCGRCYDAKRGVPRDLPAARVP